MTIYTDGAVIRRGQTLEEFQTPLGDYLGAKFDQALDANPLNLATDNRELSQAQDNVVGDYADPLTGFALGELNVTPKPRITADEVRARSEEAGVKVDVPEGGLTSEALDILIARRKKQAAYNDAIERSPFGLRSFAGFGVQLGASLLDPLNIGLAFVPVVGQARYAGMIAKAGGAAGRAGVRVGIGAAEGAVGVAAFEPLAYTMHQSLQDDYSALDSLINIGFGSALGGGLHVVGGATKDAMLGRWWEPSIPPAPRIEETTVKLDGVDYTKYDAPTFQRMQELPASPDGIPAARFDPNSAAAVTEAVSPQTREAALRTAVAQAIDGRSVDIDPIIRADSKSDAPALTSKSSTLLREWIYKTLQPNALRGKNANKDAINRIERRAAGIDDGSPARKGNEIYDYELRDVRLSQLIPTQFGEDALNDSSRYTADSIRSAKSIDEIRAEDVLPILLSPDGRVLDGNHRFTAAKLNDEQTIPALVPVRKGTGKVSNIEQYLNPSKVSRDPVDIASAVKRQSSPDSVRVADPKASEAATERLATAPKSEALADAEAELARVMNNLNELYVPVEQADVMLRDLKPYDDAIKSSEELGRAARAAAICDLRA